MGPGPWAQAAAGVGGGLPGPMGPCALVPKAPKGSGPAPVAPVAMYFHKKGIDIT